MPRRDVLRFLKSRVAGALSSDTKLRVKRLIRHTKRKLSRGRKLELTELESVLRDKLDLGAGDTLLVHSSFGSLNANFTPSKLIELLKHVVTPTGLIVMPYYPPDSAVAWLERGEVFDHRSTSSSMGVLTTLFKDDPEVHISIHPIKALAAWGKDAETFVAGHQQSDTPFDMASPYAKLGQMEHAKSIGLGIERCTYFHHCEDALLEASLDSRYLPGHFTGLVRNRKGMEIKVMTRVHDPIVMGARELSRSYLRRHGCPSFVSLKVAHCSFYSVPIPAVFDFLSELWRTPPGQMGKSGPLPNNGEFD